MIKVAVIGCGHWGPNHIRTFNNLPGCKVLALADLDKQRLMRVSEMYPAVRCEQDYHKILSDPNIDAVVVATPTQTHYQVVRESLLAGKHVLCEKPLTQTTSQASAIVELAESHGLVLMVGHVFLFNAAIVKMKELLDAGELGKLHYLTAIRTNLGPIRYDVNAAYDLAAHDISIFNWLLGSEPESVSAIGGTFLQSHIEDVVFSTLRYPGNVLANIHSSWLNPKKIRQIIMVGSQKMLTWDDLELSTPVAIYEKGATAINEPSDYSEFLRISMWDGDIRLPKIPIEEPLKVQNRHFIDSIEQRIDVERSGGRFGLGVVGVLESISQSLSMNGALVQTNLDHLIRGA